MKSGKFKKYYSDYLEGNLDQASRRRFEAALRRSPELQADYRLFVSTHRLVTGLPAEAADEDLEAQVLSRIGQVGQVKSRGRFGDFLPSWTYLVSATAASLLLGISLALFLQKQVGGDPAPSSLTEAAGDRAGGGLPLNRVSTDREDHLLNRQIVEISSLVEEINRLSERFQLEDDEILLGYSGDRELVIRPSEFYRRAIQAADRDPSAGDSVRHAY